ncbi:hypothetical protein OUZ56_000893 [Daphnia magna]|uniref:Uncharacterized protein n=1 Tax=Daphnia magna TaxID=35525 RepID=A0ABR0A126_9CRUS|nr:hypothetical protein OUZ56_000893 [Daphnia magna]
MSGIGESNLIEVKSESGTQFAIFKSLVCQHSIHGNIPHSADDCYKTYLPRSDIELCEVPESSVRSARN